MNFLFLPVVALFAGCATVRANGECQQPPLSATQVVQIADAYLKKQNMSASFRKNAERRVSEVGCNYLYEEAEKFDSFGVGIVLTIGRSGEVIDFSSSE